MLNSLDGYEKNTRHAALLSTTGRLLVKASDLTFVFPFSVRRMQSGAGINNTSERSGTNGMNEGEKRSSDCLKIIHLGAKVEQ